MLDLFTANRSLPFGASAYFGLCKVAELIHFGLMINLQPRNFRASTLDFFDCIQQLGNDQGLWRFRLQKRYV